MSDIQALLDHIATADPDEALEAALQEGMRLYCPELLAKTPEVEDEEVPVSPSPMQVTENVSDPRETDSDLAESDGEGGDEPGAVRDRSESASDDENANNMILGEEDSDDGEFEEVEDESQTAGRRRVSKRAMPKAKAPQLKNTALATAIGPKARLPNCEIGIVELLCFFPNHTQWPEAGLRAYRNQWKHPDVARIQLHARGNLNRDAYRLRVDSLKHQIYTIGKDFFGIPFFTPTTHEHLMTPVVSYDASSYAPRNSQNLFNATLVDIAEGIVNWPVGQDCGIVTQATQYAHNNGLKQYTTADIPRISQQMGFVLPSEASGSAWDLNAKGRIEQIAGPLPKGWSSHRGVGVAG